MNFTAAELAVLKSDVVNIGVFFRLQTDPVVRLWLGFGNILAANNVLDPSGAEYIGFGEIVSMPDFNQLINGAAERVEFVLSGVSGPVMAIAAANDTSAVKGKPVSVGLGIFGFNDDGTVNWQQTLAPPHWFASYTADYLQTDRQIIGDPKSAIVRTVTLSCGSLFTGRRRPSFSYYSDQDQQARFPGDKSCSLVTNYAHGYNKPFPVFS